MASKNPLLKILLICVFYCLHCMTLSAQVSEFLGEKDPNKSWAKGIVYNADSIEFAPGSHLIIGKGNVSISYKEMRLVADEVIINMEEKKAYAQGNAVLHQPDGSLIQGGQIVYDFDAQKGNVERVKLSYDPWFVAADAIEMDDQKDVTVKGGYLSTCSLDEPHWRLSTKHVEIYPGDKIVAKNASVKIGNIPIFYWPRYTYSLKGGYQNFRIVPGKNSRWGTYLLSSYNYVDSEHHDGDLRLDYRTDKGVAYGLDHEYRYDDIKGLIRFYYLNERDDKQNPMVESERYRIKWIQRQQYTNSLWGVYQFNELSDQDIIKDYIKKEYEQNQTPESSVYLQNRSDFTSVSAYGRFRTNSFFDQKEYLPELTAQTTYIPLTHTPFYLRSKMQMSSIKDKTLDISNNRLDLFQEVTASKKAGIVTFRPVIGIKQTLFRRGKSGEEEIRGTFYGEWNMRTRFHKPVGKSRLIHEPSVAYVYINPNVDPDKLNIFDALERVEYQNYWRFQWEDRLQSKREDQGLSWRSFFKHRIYVDFYPQGRFTENLGFKRLSFIEQELEFLPQDWIRFDFRNSFNPYEREYQDIKIDFTFHKGREKHFSVGHHYTREERSKTNMAVGYGLGKNWRITMEHSYDFNNHHLLRQEYVLFRNLHCVTLAVSYADKKDRNSIEREKEFWLSFYLNRIDKKAFDFTESLQASAY